MPETDTINTAVASYVPTAPDPNKFFIVVRSDRTATSVPGNNTRHISMDNAVAAATALLRTYPTYEYIILQSVVRVAAERQPIKVTPIV